MRLQGTPVGKKQLFSFLKAACFLIAFVTLLAPCNARAQKPASKQLKQVYAIERGEANILKTPDTQAEVLATAPFGQLLDVLNITKEWLLIKIPNSNEKGYIQRSAVTGDQTKIPLNNNDLAEVYTEGQERVESYPNIQISLITKQQFYAMKKSVNYFVADTNAVIKRKRSFRLPIKNGFKTFTDKPCYNKIDWNTNSYVGQYPLLNKYVIINCDGEAEDCSYVFIDKTTGKASSVTFNELPYLSQDKKTIISIRANDYHNYAELEVGKVGKTSITFYTEGQFKNWMPAYGTEKFWGTDNCFYLPVIPSVAYYQPNDRTIPPGYNYRYIRIKILGKK